MSLTEKNWISFFYVPIFGYCRWNPHHDIPFHNSHLWQSYLTHQTIFETDVFYWITLRPWFSSSEGPQQSPRRPLSQKLVLYRPSEALTPGTKNFVLTQKEPYTQWASARTTWKVLRDTTSHKMGHKQSAKKRIKSAHRWVPLNSKHKLSLIPSKKTNFKKASRLTHER